MIDLRRHGFLVVWCVAAVAAAAVYHRWDVEASFLGIVETRTHKLGALEEGRIRAVNVGLGDNVALDQDLVDIDDTELTHERAWLVGEIDRLTEVLEADRERFRAEFEDMDLERTYRIWSVTDRQAEMKAKMSEAAALSEEIDRLKRAEAEGLGRSAALSGLEIRQREVALWLRGARQALAGQQARTARGSERLAQNIQSARGDKGSRDSKGNRSSRGQDELLSRRGSSGTTDQSANGNGSEGLSTESNRSELEDIVRSRLSSRVFRIGQLRLRLNKLEHRIEQRSVRSPCAGKVVQVNYLPGDVVKAFSTILTVEEPRAEFVDAYVPEASGAMPKLGQRVLVSPRRAGVRPVGGVVRFVDPGYSAIPERLAFRKQIYWARKLRIELDRGHALMPGEAVEIALSNKTEDQGAKSALNEDLGRALALAESKPAFSQGSSLGLGSSGGGAAFAQPKTVLPTGMKTMQWHGERARRLRFEPSALAWLSELRRYLIISDDTGDGDRKHAPWLFLMDEQGTVEAAPLNVAGIEALVDIESVSLGPEGQIYLVGSQGEGKSKHPSMHRQDILELKRQGESFEVTRRAEFLSALISSTSAEEPTQSL